MNQGVLTRREREILDRLRMATDEGADFDLVQEGHVGSFYCGPERCTRTGWKLLALGAVSPENEISRENQLIYYRINERGRNLLNGAKG